ncbi:F-actin-monooxygenase Mical isoform X2 [Bacillus rossius redtenbacheri]|uniref:F-actin-monooxygenase Mical isoform X2 n=1 Tax=Bacillus rossius redtenbacheri TaxID=93214 RepID=UPI002FDCC0A5
MDGSVQSSEELALASDVFDQFCGASTQKAILGLHRHLCDLLHVKPTNFPNFYPKLKSKLRSWKAQALWAKFDKRASHKCYNRGKACPNTRVLIIGAGPCGLRTAIEAQLLGAKVVVVEKRDRFSRNNVLHLWPFVIADLRALGAKKFFGKFCAGAIDHISIRQLQCILMKVALLLGVEIHEGVGFEGLAAPPEDQSSGKIGWRAQVSPPDHPVAQYEFDVLIGADGKRNTLEGFKRKEFRGKLAIAITANFINRHSEAEARVEEISGVAFIFNQKFFKDLYAETGIDLENIVYYKDETHYFVMTAKKHSLINKGVIIQDYSDTAKLMGPDNVDKDALQRYAREAADFSTNYQLPDPEFAVNHYGQPDVAMFDFTSMFAAENASRVVERCGHKLLQILVGDSLLEPFWPTGSGCARGFLSSLDACWAVRSWGSGRASALEVLAERESVYRVLAQTTPENLQRDAAGYTLDPATRYTNLNTRCVAPAQVRGYFHSDDPDAVSQLASAVVLEAPKKRRRKDSQVHPDTLLHWLKKQVALYEGVRVDDVEGSFRSGVALCAVIHRYRPDLVDFHALDPADVAGNNQLAFDLLEHELGIPPVMTGQEMADCKVPDKLTMLSYLSQIYDTFRGEIPHIKHPRLESEHAPAKTHKLPYQPPRQASKEQALNLLSRVTALPRPSPGRKRASADREPDPAASAARADTLRRQRKRRSVDRDKLTASERRRIVEEIERNRAERAMRRRYLRHLANQQFLKSMQMLQTNDRRDPAPFEDYSLFVYRQTAPAFEDRVRDMEQKILYPDREARLRAEIAEIRKGGVDEDLSGRIRILEEKLKGTPVTEKKPRDLYRAIGKIEKSDWNVKEIEKKIQENKMGRTAKHDRKEKVPKWSREQFDDKFQAVKMKLQTKRSDFSPGDKHADVDQALRRVDKKLRDGSALDVGPKVSAMAEQFAVRTQEPEKQSLQRSNSKAAMFAVPAQGSSEMCHFCGKRVYLMERMSTEGKFFHRGCFRCEYCNTALRLGNYAFDRDCSCGGRFFCSQHFGMKGLQWSRARRKSEELKSGVDKENIPVETSPKTPAKAKSLCDDVPDESAPAAGEAMTTPERIEFENLSGAALDVEEAPSEMDEDEWTDRNFGASAAEGSSDSSSDLSDTDEEAEANEVFEEAIDQPVPVTVDATRQLAETWSRRYSKNNTAVAAEGEDKPKKQEEEKDEDDDDDDSDQFEFEDSDGDNSYHEYDSGDDESETATEGEQDEAALERRRQEVRLEVPQLPRGRKDTYSGSDTEIVSESTSTESESDKVENSATEIETDSEFEHDGTTPTHEIPAILLDDSNVTRRAHQMIEAPKKVQVRSGHILRPINGTVSKPLVPQLKERDEGVKLKFSPLCPEPDNKSTSLSNLTVGNNIINLNKKPPARTPLINPRQGDYLLNRTHSTEGIASKLSLELKKKYLLGVSGLPGSVKKSGSATTLDSKVKNFVDMISEHQKLLHPAPEPSPTMQAFLQGTSKLSVVNKPLSPTSPTFLDPSLKLPPPPSQQTSLSAKKEKPLPSAGVMFEHVCKLGSKQEVLSDVGGKSTHEINGTALTNGTKIVIPKGIFDNEPVESSVTDVCNNTTAQDSLDASQFETGNHEEADCRPRSPAHETSIIVPDIPWKKPLAEANEDDDIESDSLSSSDSLSNLDDESDDHRSGSLHVGERTTPRVEIHDTSGTLMAEGSCEEQKCSKDVMKESTEKPLSLDLSNRASAVNSADSVDRERKHSTLTSDRSSPSTPPSLRGEDSESVHNEATLAETELSDWAQDGDALVSEDLEDVEFNIDPQFVTSRRHRNVRKGGKVLGARIARAEEEFGDFDDPGHVCSLYKDIVSNNATSLLLSNAENIEYMDTGPEEDSSTDDVFAATNESLLKNKGYIQFVNSFDDEDISTPLVDAQTISTVAKAVPAVIVTESAKDGEDTSESPDTVEVSNVEAAGAVSAGELEGNTTEETTTSGEVVTVKDSPLDHEKFYTPDSECPRDIENASSQEYEDYVRRLQGRISPFSNVRDSIDVRKSRRKNKPPVQLPDLISEEVAHDSAEQPASPPETVELVSPSSTSQKLVEISRERSKQKDLIHEMVLNKMLTQKKNSSEKKFKKNRLIPSPTSPSPATPVKSFFETVPELSTVGGQGDGESEEKLNNVTETDKLNKVLKDLEVPLVDSLVDEDAEKFYTPMTSFKTKLPQSQRQRPLSVHASFTGGQRTDDAADKPSVLPDTPLTNPEAFSMPDIRRALFKSSEELRQLPVPPPRTRLDEARKATDRDRLYEEARRRARLKSDDELGLSPENYAIALREKVKSSASGKRAERCLSEPGESQTPGRDDAAEATVTESLPVEPTPRKSKSSSRLDDAPQAVATSFSQLTPNATFYVDQDATVDPHGKKKKDRDRRKSIIQAVSDFFHKKRESPSSASPPKTPVTAKEKFSKFKFSKGRDKGKSPYSSWSEDSDSDKSSPGSAAEPPAGGRPGAPPARPPSPGQLRGQRRDAAPRVRGQLVGGRGGLSGDDAVCLGARRRDGHGRQEAVTAEPPSGQASPPQEVSARPSPVSLCSATSDGHGARRCTELFSQKISPLLSYEYTPAKFVDSLTSRIDSTVL